MVQAPGEEGFPGSKQQQRWGCAEPSVHPGGREYEEEQPANSTQPSARLFLYFFFFKIFLQQSGISLLTLPPQHPLLQLSVAASI